MPDRVPPLLPAVVGPPATTFALVWEGSQASRHSFATVNRELCRQLVARGHELTLLPTDALAAAAPALPLAGPLATRVGRPLARAADAHVRHQWPPRFDPPPAGAQVVDFAWVEDFAAACNESIGHATGDRIFRLDADNRRKLAGLFADLGRDRAAYLMRQLSATEDPHGSQLAVDQVRLFRRDPALRWRYRVHEQILLAVRAVGHEVRRTDIVIGHAGYADRAQSARKLRRNQTLLEREVAELPDDPIPLYQLGQVYQQLGRTAEALPLLRRALDLAPADYSIRPRRCTQCWPGAISGWGSVRRRGRCAGRGGRSTPTARSCCSWRRRCGTKRATGPARRRACCAC